MSGQSVCSIFLYLGYVARIMRMGNAECGKK